MKVQDVRVGNHLRIDGIIVKIDERTIFDFNHDKRVKEGIPLTEDMLLRFGFEKRQESEAFYYFGYGENPMTRDWMLCLKYFKDDNKFFYLNGYFKIIYVHELQNLYFALTKQELEVNL